MDDFITIFLLAVTAVSHNIMMPAFSGFRLLIDNRNTAYRVKGGNPPHPLNVLPVAF